MALIKFTCCTTTPVYFQNFSLTLNGNSIKSVTPIPPPQLLVTSNLFSVFQGMYLRKTACILPQNILRVFNSLCTGWSALSDPSSLPHLYCLAAVSPLTSLCPTPTSSQPETFSTHIASGKVQSGFSLMGSSLLYSILTPEKLV